MVVQAPPGLTGFVVAGGRSRRMGRDKALLAWGRATLLDHAVSRLRQVTDDVRILSGAEARYGNRGLAVVADALPAEGPIAGLLAGLEATDRDLGLFLAVDVPLVPVALLRHLAALAEGFDAVVPVSPSGPEPLCAVYARSCIAPIRSRAGAGDFKMTSFWPDVRVREVGPGELAEFGDAALLFRNVNFPDDYEELLRLSSR